MRDAVAQQLPVRDKDEIFSVKDIEVKVLSTTFTKQPTETKFNSSRTSLNLNQDFNFQEKFSNSDVDINT